MAGQDSVSVVANVVIIRHGDDLQQHGAQLAAAMIQAVRRIDSDQVVILHDATEMSSATHDYAQAFAGAFRELNGRRVRQVAVIPRAVPRFFARVAMTLARVDLRIVRDMGAALAWLQMAAPAAAAALERQNGVLASSA